MKVSLMNPTISPAILQKIIHKMNYKDLATFSRTSTFAEFVVSVIRGKELKQIESAKRAEAELKAILFPESEDQLSLALLQAYKNTSKWLVDSAERDWNQTKQYPNLPLGIIQMTEERLTRIRHTVELAEIVIKYWIVLHNGEEEKTRAGYFDDSVFG